MKKTFIFIMFAIFAITTFSSCKTQIPYAKYTTSTKLCEVKVGQTFDEVTAALGCPPYDLLSKQVDGYDIYLFKYKIVERLMAEDMINTPGVESAGTLTYRSDLKDAFLIFSNNKLESMITSLGRDNSVQLVLLNNTLYKIIEDATGKYTLIPSHFNELKSQEQKPLLPGFKIFKK